MNITSGFDGGKLRGFLAEIDIYDDELETLRGEYMEACQSARDGIKEIKKAVKEEGVNPVAFRELLTTHRAERAEQKRLAAMNPEDRDDFEAMQVALGAYADTPLGQAALRRAKPQQENEEAFDSLS